MESIFELGDISGIATNILRTVPSKTLAFHGTMGVGKTTLIKALVSELGAKGSTSSPTFGIVNEYQDAKGKLLAYHFDFYRLERASEALDMGLEDYLYSDVWIFMEWPEKIADLLPRDTAHIFMDTIDANTRKLWMEPGG